MFGGLGGALKNITGKAEEMMEKTKQQVGELAAEKKAAAQALLENQAKKTGEMFSSVKGEATTAANEAQQQAIDGFDQELANAEKVVESSVNEGEQKAASATSSVESAAAGALTALGGVEGQVEQAVQGAVTQVSAVVDDKIKEADKFLDEKREETVAKVQEETNKASSTASEGISNMLGKAKGLLNF